MPFKPATPATKEIAVPEIVPENTYHLHEIHIFVSPNDPMKTKADVVWTKGYLKADPELYAQGDVFMNELEGIEFLTKMQEAVPPGLTYYEAVKRGFWEFLKERGIVPDGTVE